MYRQEKFSRCSRWSRCSLWCLGRIVCMASLICIWWFLFAQSWIGQSVSSTVGSEVTRIESWPGQQQLGWLMASWDSFFDPLSENKKVEVRLDRSRHLVQSLVVTHDGTPWGQIVMSLNDDNNGEINIRQWALRDATIFADNLDFGIQAVTERDCASEWLFSLILPDGTTACSLVTPDDVDEDFDDVYQRIVTGVCPDGMFVERVERDGTAVCRDPSPVSCNSNIVDGYVFPHRLPVSQYLEGVPNICGGTIRVPGIMDMGQRSCESWDVLIGYVWSSIVCASPASTRASVGCPEWSVMDGLNSSGQAVCKLLCEECE